MRIAGHAMATPELSAFEAIDLFASIGLDGIELVSDASTGILPDQMDAAARRALRDAATGKGLQVACLTPYFWEINAADPGRRHEQVEGTKRALQLAADLGAAVVRSYAGRPAAAPADAAGAFERAAAALAEIGQAAGDLGLRVGVENHTGSLATSARATVALVQACGSPHVGIVYDQGNLTDLGAEPWEQALPMQRARIVHVHVKDMDYAGPGGKRRARMVGEGVVPWSDVVRALAASGYDGWLSLEYERKWHPDELPSAAEGLPPALARIRAWLGEEKK
jgi:sugar phosphate isomerase/epimerase